MLRLEYGERFKALVNPTAHPSTNSLPSFSRVRYRSLF